MSRSAPAEVHQESTACSGRARSGAGQAADHYFVGRVADERRPLGEVAAMHVSDGIDASRWWTLAELDATDETVYPPGLADLVRSARAERA